ncbi:MAG: Trk system potassium transporter TrkA [Synergistaceae bacterium]|nr:Trk system potassium transporter TrkA [Synergistaceae bacterium]
MKIVIVGAGEIGRTVAQKLSLDPDNKHDIYLIENNEAQAKNAEEALDVQVIRGNGARPQILAQAGVISGGDVDLLIACTNRDEVNMLSCWIALNAGVKHVISRTRSLEFTDSPYWGNKLGIKVMISPERSIAREVIGLLEVSSATHTAELLDGRAALYTLKISENSKLVNMALKDLRNIYPDLMAVFVHVEHEDGTAGVPNGFTVLKANDVCYVVTYKKSAEILQEVFQPDSEQRRSLKKLFIVGGGKLGTQIAQLVRREFGSVEMRIIEKDPAKCEKLSEEFGEALILNCDGADINTLKEEGIESADGYICATESDEVNLICSVIAKEKGAGKTIAIVRRKEYQELTKSIPVDAIVDPNDAMSNLLLRVIRYPKHTRAFSMIEKINAEMLEVVIQESNEFVGRTLAEIRLQKGVIVALLGRGDEILVPTGATRILAGDHVILFALTSLMPEAAKLFGAEVQEAAKS